MPQSPVIGQNADGGIPDFWIIGQSLTNENYDNFKTSHGNDMKLRPVTKFDKRNRATLKNLAVTSCQQIVTSLSFFRFMTNLKQSGSWIPDAKSIILIFSLSVTFYLTRN